MFIYVLVAAGVIMTTQGPQGVEQALESFPDLKSCEAKKHELVTGGLAPQVLAAGLTCSKITLEKNKNFKAPEPKFD